MVISLFKKFIHTTGNVSSHDSNRSRRGPVADVNVRAFPDDDLPFLDTDERGEEPAVCTGLIRGVCMPEYCCVRDGKGILPLLTVFQTGAEHAIGVTWPKDALIRIAHGFHDPFLGSRVYPTQVCMERK
jgi:hypothetical protein